MSPEAKAERRARAHQSIITIPATAKTTPQRQLPAADVMEVIRVSEEYARQKTRKPELSPFQLPKFPPRAVPPNKAHQLAMDESLSWANTEWAGAVLGATESEGLLFLGYPYLAELAQRPEYRIITETIATEMTRKWISFKGTTTSAKAKAKGATDEEAAGEQSDADAKNEKIKQLTDFMDHLQVRDRFAELATHDGFFGRAHLYLDDGNPDQTDEIKTPIGDGRDNTSKAKIGKDWLKSLRTVEPVWAYPTTYNAQNPLKGDWYNPQVWYVMGKEIHRSRLLTFIGREVPDLLKPAYSFGGLSLSQLAKPYVDIWLKTRESVGTLIHSFSVMVLMTDLQTILQPGNAAGLMARVAMFNALRDNQGTFVVNKATEDFKNVSAQLGGLHELQAQSQEHMASVARIPLVKFTGISPAGLNASSEGEMRAFYDTINAYQNKFFRPNLNTVVSICQRTLWGEPDPDIVYDFEPLWALSEKEEGDKRKADAETDGIYIDKGVIGPEEVRAKVAADPDSPYHGIDPDDVPDLAEEEANGLEPGKGGEGGGPGGGGGGGDDDGGAAADASILPFDRSGGAADSVAWNEADHPRGQPGNAGQFGSGGGGGGKPEKQKLTMPQYGLTAPPQFMHSFGWQKHKKPKPKSEGEPSAAGSVVVFARGSGEAPKTLNGTAFKAWEPPEDWSTVDGTADIGEPPAPELPEGMTLSSGVIIREPDGRVWLLRPKGGYGGYDQTFPKGGVEDGLSMQANAIKEAYEETGLKVRITGFAGDHEGDVSITRYYTAEREGGDPATAGEESEGVILTPVAKLKDFLNRKRDLTIAAQLEAQQPPLDPAKMKKVGKQMGSNPGGVYEDTDGKRYYIKQGQTKDHVKNELLAAKLYELAGSPTLNYRPVKGDGHVATEMVKLDKDRASKLSPAEIKEAQEEFAVHAWLSNYDAVGTGGDNLGTVDGHPVALDLGGALAYRAQGKPKGDAFGNTVGELKSMRDPKISHDGSKVFGPMTPAQIKASAKHVTDIPDQDIRMTVKQAGLDDAMADKLIARKADIAKQVGIATDGREPIEIAADVWAWDQQPEWDAGALDDAGHFEESKHPRDNSGKFAATAGGGGGELDDDEPEPEEGETYPGFEKPSAAFKPKPSGGGVFKSKKEHVAHLLTEGTTTAQILEATGWPSVSVPAMAKAAGMKLEKYKEDGVTKYKGTPMTVAEKQAAEAETKAKAAAAKVSPAVQAAAEISGKPVAEVAKVAMQAPAPKQKFPPATPAELEKAKKNVALQLQYVPGAPQNNPAAQKLVDKFNEKYAGMAMPSQAHLEQKVQDFKQLQADMIPLMTAQQQAAAKEAAANAEKNAAAIAAQKEAAAKQAAAQKAKEVEEAKAAAEQNKGLMKELGITEVEAVGFVALAKMLGGKQSDIVTMFKGYEKRAKILGYPITGFQAALISNYSNGGYSHINDALRKGSWSKAQHVYVKMVNKALAKMPRYTGMVNRGTTLSSTDQAKYVVGNVVPEMAFTSTSTGKGFSGNTSFKIKAIGKRGASIKQLSQHHSESEVLFAARTFFHVTKVEGSPGGHMTVHMEEMEDDDDAIR